MKSLQAFFSIILLATAACSNAWAETISIASPIDGQTYQPGDIVDVHVVAPDQSVISLFADLRLQVTPLTLYGAPYDFRVQIPRDSQAAKYVLTVLLRPVGTNPAPNPVTAKVGINLSPTALDNSKLTISSAEIWLSYTGQVDTVHVYLEQNGLRSKVSYSENLKAESSDPIVVAVSGNKLLAKAAGKAFVSFTYGSAQGKLVVYNSASEVRGDLNSNGVIDLDDLNIIKAALGQRASDPNDARDLNGDGKIDALDLRILTTLCTYPRCASTKP